MVESKSSEDWIRDSSVETTFSLSFDDSEVSFLTPAGSPGVLDLPEVFTVLATETDKEDTVIELLRIAESGIRDTTGVELEIVGIDGNGEGTNVEEGGGNDGFISADINEAGSIDQSFGHIVLALAINTFVGIGSFGFELGSLEVSESVVHKTTIATLIGDGVTINKLLFGEGDEISAHVEEVLTLNTTSGRESPA